MLCWWVSIYMVFWYIDVCILIWCYPHESLMFIIVCWIHVWNMLLTLHLIRNHICFVRILTLFTASWFINVCIIQCVMHTNIMWVWNKHKPKTWSANEVNKTCDRCNVYWKVCVQSWNHANQKKCFVDIKQITQIVCLSISLYGVYHEWTLSLVGRMYVKLS